MIHKHYLASEIEPRIYDIWEKANAFAAGAGKRGGDPDPYCIVIPPPNVTGSLHMGHALNNTLQDTLVRFKRMQGRDVLWQCGTDHAGIATQMVVERQLAEQQIQRRDLGREEFIKRVWEWKAESGGTILNQLKRLGASCDWSRERFTLDEGLSKAVLKVFVTLHKEGLIYRNKRLVNWDPKFQTAISDLEVEQVEIKGSLWHLRYPLADGLTCQAPTEWDDEGKPTAFETRDYVVVATTRPETMLGDTGLAVHPEDPRYRDLIGKHVVLPLVGRRIPIVGDDHADPETGSGAVKMTPAHDFNDFEVGRRQNLRMINVLDQEARLHLKDNADFLEALPASEELDETLKLHGQDRFLARERIVERMDDLGLLDHVEAHTHMVPHGDRSNTVIEPFLTDQWYVDARTLAKPAIDSVRSKRITFVPRNWEKTYFEWMENIQPWCISRQLWWGHQIPAWYGPDGEVFVAMTEVEAHSAAREHYGRDVQLTRDSDVLDTWFSSALWPFSTLGWPEETEELKRYYQTDVLITGLDIIFFWVARMVMIADHFMEEEPFHTVYIHALVRDLKGQKMSKSKGNVIDPLELIDEFGADALRFTLIAMAAQGRDIRLARDRVAGYRNFCTKIWNAVRFAEMNQAARAEGFDPAAVDATLNRWIIAETARTSAAVTEALDAYRFNDAAGALYRFLRNTFCDWYLELSKPILNEGDARVQAEIRATMAWVLDQAFTLLHPMMPFLTEELWQATKDWGAPRAGAELLIHQPWPELEHGDASAAAEIGWLVDVISSIRSVRAEMNVPASARLPLEVLGASDQVRTWLDRHTAAIVRLARVTDIAHADQAPGASAQIVVGEAICCLPLEGVVDFSAEQARLSRDLGKLAGEIGKLQGKLGNEKFLAKAPEEVVAEQKGRLEEALARREKLRTALDRLNA